MAEAATSTPCGPIGGHDGGGGTRRHQAIQLCSVVVAIKEDMSPLMAFLVQIIAFRDSVPSLPNPLLPQHWLLQAASFAPFIDPFCLDTGFCRRLLFNLYLHPPTAQHEQASVQPRLWPRD